MFKLKNELWERRYLIWNFAITDLKIRYRNSILGFVWSFLEPLLILSVLYFVFTNIFKGQIVNYPLYLLLGIITWNMFTRGTTIGLSSIVGKAGIVSQISFPKEILALSSTITASIMLGFELIVLGLFMVAYHFTPPITILFLPLILIFLFIFTVGLSLALSVLNVYFRDMQFIWGVIVHAGFFFTPILYKLDMLPVGIRNIVQLNPMASIIHMAQNLTLYGILPTSQEIIYTISIVTGVFMVGFLVFRRLEKRVVEEI